jgi:hypothetical protein
MSSSSVANSPGIANRREDTLTQQNPCAPPEVVIHLLVEAVVPDDVARVVGSASIGRFRVVSLGRCS